MPRYEYQCKQCHTEFELFRIYSDSGKKGKCPSCERMCTKLISLPHLVTDTNFGYTGRFDPRLGGPKIEGRADFKRRLELAGKEECDYGSSKPRSNDTAKRLKEKCGVDINWNTEPSKWKKAE